MQPTSDHIGKAAEAMGLCVSYAHSGISASSYVYVGLEEEGEGVADIERAKIRCSDHDDKHGGSDWQVLAGDCPSTTIARLAKYFGKVIPKGYQSEDYVKCTISAQGAALDRSLKKEAAEEKMVAETVRSIRETKTASKVAAWKIIDENFPGIPRAQRQRVVYGSPSSPAVFYKTCFTLVVQADFGNYF